MKRQNWKKYAFEFLSIFIAVISAFALNNWNENRRDNVAESKILSEISNGLKKDIEDVRLNAMGHKEGISACKYWRKIISNEKTSLDSLQQYYLALTRDFVSIQNISGYESLKSKGLEVIKNDSLRIKIISIYEYDYNTLKKLEEEYNELQFQENYFKELNGFIAPKFQFDSKGNIHGLELPLKLTSSERNIILSYLWKIQINRRFVLQYYNQIEEKIIELRIEIEKELKR